MSSGLAHMPSAPADPDRLQLLQAPISTPSLLREVTAKVSESGIRMVLGIIVAGVVARRLDLTSFASLSYALSLLSLATPFAQLGLEPLLSRLLAVGKNLPIRHQFLKILRARLGGSAAASALLVLVTFQNSTYRSIGFILAVGVFFVVGEAFVVVLQFRCGSAGVARLRMIAFAIGAISRITAATLCPTASALLLATLLEPFVLLVLAVRPALANLAIEPGPAKLDTLTALRLRKAAPFFLSSLAVMVYTRADVALLQRWSTTEQLALYTSAVKVSELAYFVPVAVATAISPRLLSLFATDRMAALAKLRRAAIGLGGTAVVFALVVACLAKPLLVLAFGTKFAPASGALRVHVLAIVTVAVGVIREIWFVANDRGIASFFTTGAGAIVNIALNAWLVPTHGAVGAAISTTAAYTVAVFVMPLFSQTGREFFGLPGGNRPNIHQPH